MAARLQKLASKSGATQNEFVDVLESVLKSKNMKNFGEVLKSYIDTGKPRSFIVCLAGHWKRGMLLKI